MYLCMKYFLHIILCKFQVCLSKRKFLRRITDESSLVSALYFELTDSKQKQQQLETNRPQVLTSVFPSFTKACSYVFCRMVCVSAVRFAQSARKSFVIKSVHFFYHNYWLSTSGRRVYAAMSSRYVIIYLRTLTFKICIRLSPMPYKTLLTVLKEVLTLLNV